ncbi:Isonitrile hydratase [Alphaproteobacteria bacterium SO-S41]|nr:Isonitrile hydratase [Alphaproteobacteria bacterium SO-S41]
MNIAILVFDDAEELDFVGPWEVFTMVKNVIAAQKLSVEAPHVFTVSENGGTVRCAKGMRVIADHSFADAPKADVLLVPGGQGTRREVDNAAMIAWIAAQAAGAAWVTSVCTGALLLAAAGPAKDRVVTTHWAFVAQLRQRGEAKEVRADMRYVRDGNVVTAAGVSAGIDMALWLTGQIWSPDLARATQKGMEYDPAPPYQAMV